MKAKDSTPYKILTEQLKGFFEDKDKIGKYSSSKERNKAVLYIGKNNYEMGKNSNFFSKWSEGGESCSEAKYLKQGSFLIGSLENLEKAGFKTLIF